MRSCALLYAIVFVASAGMAQTAHNYCGVIESVSDSELRLKAFHWGEQSGCETRGTPALMAIQVQGQSLKDSMKNWKPGDRVIAGVTDPQGGSTSLILQDLKPQTSSTAIWQPPVVALLAGAVLLVLSMASGDWRGLLFIGHDNRYSNSKTQVSLWFGVMIVSYITTFLLRWLYTGFVGQIGIPTNLLILSGLSGLTFAGAKGIAVSKDATAASNAAAAANAPAAANAAAAAGNASAATAILAAAPAGAQLRRKTSSQQASFPSDLLKDDDGKFDFGDYQMLVITLIAIVTYSVLVLNFLGTLEQRVSITLPDVDSTMLALFGVGHGAYLTKKAVSGAGE